MGLNLRQQVVVDAFRAEYEMHSPEVQAEIAKAVSVAERHIWGVCVFFLGIGILFGLAIAQQF